DPCPGRAALRARSCRRRPRSPVERRGLMPRRSPVRVTWSRPVTPRRLSPRKGTPRRVSGGRVARLLAYGDAGEASHLDVFADRGDVFREQLTDGFLVVLDVRLVDEDDLGKVAVEASFDDLSDHVFRFAFCCGFFGQAGAFRSEE